MSSNMRDFREPPPRRRQRRITVAISITITISVVISVWLIFGHQLPFSTPIATTPTAISGGSTAQSFTPSSSGITQGSCLNKIGGKGISQGETITTDPNLWTIFRGDISYVDPNTGSQVFVKSANGDDSNAFDVGSLLAVRGSVMINGVNQAGYDLYPGTTTIDQIKQELNCDKNTMINITGCQGKCRAVSEVLIDGKTVTLLGG